MEITIEELRKLTATDAPVACLSDSTHEWDYYVGKKVFLRTVTYHFTGEVLEVVGCRMTLTTAAWIADSGRFADALQESEFLQVEPYPGEVSINIDTLIDISLISKLPEDQK